MVCHSVYDSKRGPEGPPCLTKMDRINTLMNKKTIRLIRWVSPPDRGLRGHSLDARFWISASPRRGFGACNLAPRSRDMNTRQSLLASEAWRVLALWQAFYVDLPRSPRSGHDSRHRIPSSTGLAGGAIFRRVPPWSAFRWPAERHGGVVCVLGVRSHQALLSCQHRGQCQPTTSPASPRTGTSSTLQAWQRGQG